MATLTLNIPETVITRIKVSARAHNHTVEEESIEILEQATARLGRKLKTPEEKAAIIAKLKVLREDFAAKGIWMTPEEVKSAIEYGRE